MNKRRELLFSFLCQIPFIILNEICHDFLLEFPAHSILTVNIVDWIRTDCGEKIITFFFLFFLLFQSNCCCCCCAIWAFMLLRLTVNVDTLRAASEIPSESNALYQRFSTCGAREVSRCYTEYQCFASYFLRYFWFHVMRQINKKMF